MTDNAIRDLSTIPASALFNSPLMLTGLLAIAGGPFPHSHHGRRGVTATLIPAGIDAIGVGGSILDVRGIHGPFLLTFVAFNSMAIACASLVRGPVRSRHSGHHRPGVTTVTLLGDPGAADPFGPVGHSGAERMAIIPAIIWMLGFVRYMIFPAGKQAQAW